jgi:hypothetical protein
MTMTAAKKVVTYYVGMAGPVSKLCRVAQKSYVLLNVGGNCKFCLIYCGLSSALFTVQCHQVHISLNWITHISHTFS